MEHGVEERISATTVEYNILEHAQYRSRCPYCVASKGVSQRHIPVVEEAGGLPLVPES